MMALLLKELSELYRSKKLLILVGIMVFTAVSSAIFAKLLPQVLENVQMPEGFILQIPEPTWKDAVDQFIKNISQIVLIVVVLVFAGSVAEEKSKKTFEIILTKPVSRTRLLLSKFLSGAFALTAAFILSSTIFYFYTTSLFGSFSAANFAYLAIFILIFILLVLTITVFASTITGSQIVAAGLSFFIEVVIMAVLPYFKSLSKYLPTYTLNQYKDLMQGGNVDNFLPSIIVSIVLMIIFAAVSVSLFKNQEIER